MSNSFNDEIYHFGIKGMKWGVRRYQNKDGTYTEAGKKRKNATRDSGGMDESEGRVVLKKGQELYRTTDKKETHKGHAYVTISKEDAKNYEGWGDVHATYKALKDITIPTENERIRTAVELIKKDDEVRMAVAKAQIGFTSGNYKKLTESSLEKLGDKPYRTFANMLDENSTVRDKYFQSLSKKGFNAVEDIMDKGFMADMPIIIFDREKTLSKAKYS